MTRELDLTPYVGRPCDLFTDADATDLGIRRPTGLGAGTKDSPSCFSLPAAGEAGVSYTLAADDSRFDSLFDPDYHPAWFRQSVIAGQPAAEHSVQSSPSTYCTVVVAIARRQSLTVEFVDRTDNPAKWVCDRATAAAETMVKRLGGR